MSYYNKQTKNQKKVRESILQNGYYKNDESSIEELFERVSSAFSTDEIHQKKIYEYLVNGWFLPATPILANAGSSKNMPISCFLNEAEDTLKDIIDTRVESEYLTSYGGGIGTNFSNIREVGCAIKDKGETAGVIPTMIINYKAVDAIMQAGTRRGALAAYLHISHPEIEEFLYIRFSGGENKRKVVGVATAHHGIIINDEFMHAVANNEKWYFISPNTKQKAKYGINARELWQDILIMRHETGEPYIVFEDNVNKHLPFSYEELDLKVKMSNLCTEIMLTTGKDHLDKKRTAVCCLSSLNLYTYDEWRDNQDFIQDILMFLDNVLQYFIDNAPDEIACARYSAMRERSVGLGVMGFHSYLQKHLIDIESEEAFEVNERIFGNIHDKACNANTGLAQIRGSFEDYYDVSEYCRPIGGARFTHIFAIAPTATIGKIAGQVSQGIEPHYACVYTDQAKEGTQIIITPTFQELLNSKKFKPEFQDFVISTILKVDGDLRKANLQLGGIFSAEEMKAFKPWRLIEQKALIRLAAQRQAYICQGQSLNVLLSPTIAKEELHEIHWLAWKLGLKSLYYCRGFSISDFGNKECEVCQ